MRERWTVREVLDWTRGYLRRGGVEAARLEAEILLAHALQVERLELYLHPDRALSETERQRFRELIQERRRGVPLQYLLGEVEFFDCRLKVSPAALIPRAETEELVERMVGDLSRRANAPWQILDLGTGTGAIAIALARAFKNSQILAVDISADALALAQENARRNGVSARVHLLQSDWLSQVTGEFDLIVTNPPYVNREALKDLQREVQQEPPIALDGGQAGLEAIALIVAGCPRHLKPDGALYLEIGEAQGPAVRELLQRTAALAEPQILKDHAGKDRFAHAVRRAAAHGDQGVPDHVDHHPSLRA
jgi:release factor glutamine methyltransferase